MTTKDYETQNQDTGSVGSARRSTKRSFQLKRKIF